MEYLFNRFLNSTYLRSKLGEVLRKIEEEFREEIKKFSQVLTVVDQEDFY